MSDMSTALQLLLVKPQTDFGTPETDLSANDLIETIGQPTLKWNSDGTSIKTVGGNFGSSRFVPGAGYYDVSFQHYMATGGAAGNFGQTGRLLDICAMLRTESDEDSDLTDETAVWTFTSVRTELKDATIWMYSGDKSEGGALLRKTGNVILLPKWSFESGKPVTMEISAVGTYEGPATAATQPDVTKQQVHIPALMDVTGLTINGETGYRLLSGSIDAQQQASLSKDVSKTYGRGRSGLSDREITGSFTVYKELPSVVDPETALINRTEGALSVEYGTAPDRISFDSDYCQINDIEHSEDEGFETWTLSVQFNRDDLKITMNTSEG